MKKTVIVIILLITAAFLAGCTSTGPSGQETAQGTVRAHYENQESWSFGLGCYNKVSGYAYNAGTTPIDTVTLNFNLINTKTGTIRDSRSVFIGTLGPSQSVTFESVLDGECTEPYRVEGMVGK